MSTTWPVPVPLIQQDIERSPTRATWPQALKVYVGMHGLWLVLYAFLGKGFAYAGWAPFFVSELLLVASIFALLASRTIGALFKTSLGMVSVAFVLWQLLCTVPHVEDYGIDTLRDAALWGYSIFAWSIAALTLRLRGFLHTAVTKHYERFCRVYVVLGAGAWLVSLFFRDSLPHWPDTGVSIPLIKGGEFCVHIAGILAFAFSGLSKKGPWIALIMADSLLGMGVRGGFLAFVVAAAFILLLKPQVYRVTLLALSSIVVLVAMATFDVRFTIPGMSREFSVDQLFDSVSSVVGVSERQDLEGTKSWRLAWWGTIRDYTINGDFFWLGKGYGINLADSDGYQVGTRDEPLRSPHNSHLTFLARSGVPGFCLWVLLQVTWLTMMLHGYVQASRRRLPLWPGLFAWLSAYWIAFTVSASFDVFLEGPMAAIPFWSLFGLGWGAYILFQKVPPNAPQYAHG